ncbi:MAG: thioesterase [Defluviitaleaceae bacterium]|nr:thioesterase [Defluviitaleaceae bacterium]MCL2275702.1 thioesterase [Defluviitaleaceae bacterium]
MYDERERITYYDLDGNGVLKFSAFLRMVHNAADINAGVLGVGFTQLSPLGMSFVLQRFSADATRLPAYGEEVRIRTWPAALERGTFIRKGEMLDTAGNKLIEWASLWLLFDINERKILRPSALPVTLVGIGDEGVLFAPQKIEPLADARPFSSHTHIIRFADIDTNAHTNNAIYGDMINNAAHAPNREAPWKQLHINYLAETRLGDEINIVATKSESTIHITGAVDTDNGLLAKQVFSSRVVLL